MNYKSISTLGVLVSFLPACGEQHTAEEEFGSVRAAVEASGSNHDVTAFRVDIVGVDQGCDAPALQTKTVPLEVERLTDELAGSGNHASADALFVLPADSYRICVAPLAGDEPSAECQPADAVADVAAGKTTEVVLFAQCGSERIGGLDVVAALNDRPEITSITLDPSKFITSCESVTITASATDGNDDTLSYAWTITSGSAGATLRTDDATATFFGGPGEYEITLSVDDGRGGESSLSFPLHVSAAVCEVPAAVQEIFTTRCSPCHTTGASGGLRLDGTSASFANLVGVSVGAAACAERTRVIPGDAEDSYLMAKLRGDADICGRPMPLSPPALSEKALATIANWINSLPH